MKTFILKIILFFSIVAAIDICFSFTCDYLIKNAKSGTTNRLVDLCEKDNYDLLILGSSKARHNYIPQVFSDSLGMSCYNAGFDGNGIILAYGILSMIDDDRLPKLIVYDLKPQFDVYHYNEDGDYARYYQQLKPFHGDPVINGVIGDISKLESVKLHSGLYRNNGLLFGVVSSYLKRQEADPDNGFVPVKGVLTDDSVPEKDYETRVDSLKLSYFQRFIRLAKEKDIDLVIVFSPEFNTPFTTDFQPVREICSAEGITILDYFDDSSFQHIELFGDHCHMNYNGARLFSARVAHDIHDGFVINN